ncbi:MAG: GNAT family N-acetyltransferase [Chloroflexota bacterium]
MITLRKLNPNELTLAGEIDVSEEGNALYQCVDGRLNLIQQSWQRADWSAHTWQENLDDWQFLGFDEILGAFHDKTFVGMAILGYDKTATTAQLVSIHVSRPYQRQGIGGQLIEQLIELARQKEKKQLYVWATNSQSAVDFYLKHGFQPIQTGHVFYEEVEDDIPMLKILSSESSQ